MALLNKALGLLTIFLLLLALFTVIFYMVYFYIPSVRGSYTITITAEKPLENVVLELPTTEDGRPIYRIKEITCFVKSNGYLREVEPTVTGTVNGYPKSIVLPITGTGTFNIVGEYILEEEKLIDYSKYPWTLVVNSKTYEVPVYVERDVMLQVIYVIKENSMVLVPSLGILTALFGGLSITRLFRGMFFKKKMPAAPKKPKKKCTGWCRVCVNFFRIKQGSETGEQLPKQYVDKLMKLLLGVNKIWEKCCIKFVPCTDEKGNIIAKYVNPQTEIAYTVETGKIIAGKYRIGYKLVRKVNLKNFFRDPNSTKLEVSKGKVNVPYREELEATWKTNVKYSSKEYKAGESVPVDVLKDIVNDVLKRIEKTLKEKEKEKEEGKLAEDKFQAKKERLLKLKEFYEHVSKVIKESGKVKVGDVAIIDALRNISKLGNVSLDKCINVFIVDEYEDVADKREEGGCGELPGRVTIIEEKVVEKNMYKLLAHELGHNLNLDHVPPNPKKPNLMEAVVKGDNLVEKQCEKALDNCKKDKRKHFTKEHCHQGLKCLRGIEILKEINELKRKNKIFNDEIKELMEDVKDIDKRLEANKKLLVSKEKTLRKEKTFFRKVSNVAKKAKHYKELLKSKRKSARKYAERNLRRMKAQYERELKKLNERLDRAIENKWEKTIKWLKEELKKAEILLEAVKNPEVVLKKYSEILENLKKEVDKIKEDIAKAHKDKERINNKIEELRRKISENEKKIKELYKELEKLGLKTSK